MSPRSSRPPYAVPSRRDPVVALATRAIGGPAGRYLAVGTRGLAGVAAALIAMSSLLIGLGVFQKAHCVANGWANPDQFWRACYSDIPVVHVTTALAQRDLPWAGAAPSDQPLLPGLTLWLISLVSPAEGTGVDAQTWVFSIWAVCAVLLLAAGVLAGVALRPHRPWQVAHLAASPVIVVLALTSLDLLAVTLTLWGLWAWHHRHPVAAGLLLGVALLGRPYPLVFLAAAAFVGWRDGRRRDALTAAVTAPLAALALYLPFSFAVPAVGTAVRSWTTAEPGYGGLTLVPQLLGASLLAPVATAIAVLGWVAALLAGGWLTFSSRHRPSTVQVAAVMLLVVLLTAKSVSVQSGLWLLPVMALAAVQWRDHLIWAAAEIIHFEAVWLHIGFGSDAGKGLPGSTYAGALMLRLLAWAWVCWQVWDSPLTDDEPMPRRTDAEAGLRAELARR